MKRVCPRCRARLHTLYVRIPGTKGTYGFVALDTFGWCDGESSVIHLPSKRAMKGAG